jgi:redox-sensitive bicupin YhaK (pirin superfamily)
MSGTAPIISDSHLADVGGLPVHRALPRRERRTVGAWCFLDHFGPVDVTPSQTMTVGPHPHIGLHTVTWLLSGEVLHSDSLGNEQLIRPGQLNLMTSGRGIAHAEDARDRTSGTMDGAQLWVAQPETTRHDPPSFAHYEDLPIFGLKTGTGTVLVGEFAGARSSVRIDSPLVGVDVAASGALEFPVDPTFEYGFAVLHGNLRIACTEARPDQFVYVGTGREVLQFDLDEGSRVLLLGGEPFPEEILMWWNFVARTRAEMERAYADWSSTAERFGSVRSTLDRVEAPRPFWLR